MKNAETIVLNATNYADLVEWLAECPVSDGQPYYETAHPRFEEMGEAMVEAAQAIGDDSILKAIESALTESDWGEFDEEAAFWRFIANWALGKTL